MPEFFLTGTDTGVGKTLVAAALLRAAGARGLRTIGLKPVAAGGMPEGGHCVNEDVLLLQGAASVPLTLTQVNAITLGTPMAPHLAAAEEGVRLDVAPLARACREVAAIGHDLLIAEGAGGWLVPLNERETMADLAIALGWPVIVVIGMRLGCLNHALLSAAAVRSAGLTLAGWVANSIGPPMHALDANIASLEARLDAPRLGTIPWLGSAASVATAAPHVDPFLLPDVTHARV